MLGGMSTGFQNGEGYSNLEQTVKTPMTVVHLCQYTINYWTAHFKGMGVLTLLIIFQ